MNWVYLSMPESNGGMLGGKAMQLNRQAKILMHQRKKIYWIERNPYKRIIGDSPTPVGVRYAATLILTVDGGGFIATKDKHGHKQGEQFTWDDWIDYGLPSDGLTPVEIAKMRCA